MADQGLEWEEIANDAYLPLQDPLEEEAQHLFDVDPDTPTRLLPAGLVLNLMVPPTVPGQDGWTTDTYQCVYDHIFQLALDPRCLASDCAW